jgi:hypothetical protein
MALVDNTAVELQHIEDHAACLEDLEEEARALWDEAYGDEPDDDDEEEDESEDGPNRQEVLLRQVSPGFIALWPDDFPPLLLVAQTRDWCYYGSEAMRERASGVFERLFWHVIKRLQAVDTRSPDEIYRIAPDIRLLAWLIERHACAYDWGVPSPDGRPPGAWSVAWLDENLYTTPAFLAWERARVRFAKGSERYRTQQAAYDRERNQTPARRQDGAARKRAARAQATGAQKQAEAARKRTARAKAKARGA